MYVLVEPALQEEPAPAVFQLPAIVHAPVVTVRMPDAPPVIVTPETVTVEAFAVRTPPFPMTRVPPAIPKSAVASVVDPAPPWIVSVPAHRRACVLIVNVVVLAPELNVRDPPNSGARFANVIVCGAEALKVVAARKLQEAEVLLFVQDPLTVQDPAPEVTKAVAVAMLTLPPTSTVEVPVAREPVPLTVSPP